MKRNVLLALFAALALAVSFGSVASAGTGENAQASAKKGKGKGCKGKKGKGKAKGQTSAAASAKGKAKGKCKGKGKGPKPKPVEPTPAPAPPTPAPPPPPSNWPPADGTYSDSGKGIGLALTGGASTAKLTLAGNGTCIPLAFNDAAVPTSVTPEGLSANGSFSATIIDETISYSWKLSLGTNLGYTLTVDSKREKSVLGDCDKPGVVIQGTLAKAG